MARPSQHTDQLLLKAARSLLEETGCSGLNIRHVADKAKVNLGMFHYHFKTKEEFCRQLLQGVYEDFFKEFSLESGSHDTAVANLRAALILFGRFVRDNRRLAFVLIRDAMLDESVVVQFVQANIPRHVRIIVGLIRKAKRNGEIGRVSLANATATALAATGFVAVMADIVRRQSGLVGKMTIVQLLEGQILSDKAIAERVDWLLRGWAP